MNIDRALSYTSLLCFFLVCCVPLSCVHGIDTTWALNGNGDWNVGMNWSDGLPGTGDNAIIRNLVASTNPVVVSVAPGVTRDVGDVTIIANGANPHQLVVSNDSFFDVHGDIINDGLITLAATTSATLIRADGSNVFLSGNGRMVLAGTGTAGLAATGNFTITNSVDHTVEGAGNLGQNLAVIVNEGLVDANTSGETLVIDPRNNGGGISTFTNVGIARASQGGILRLAGNGLGEFGGNGTYESQDGSEILVDSARVQDSTFTTSGSGLIRTTNGSNTEFVNVTNNGDFRVGDNSDAQMAGTLTNTGTITLASTGNQSDFELGADVTLTGGGSLVMAGDVAQVNSIGNFLLTNVNNTIEGHGNLGGNSAMISNSGLIHANVNGEVLNIDPRNNGGGISTFVNNTMVRASGGGIVQLNGNGLGEFGGNGVYEALDGSEVVIASAIIGDAIFRTSGSGKFRTTDSSNSVFVDIVNQGSFEVGNNADAQMVGTISNSGTITLASTGSQSDFELGANVTLAGGGTLIMTGGAAQVNSVGNFLLTNHNNTIEGYGNLGGNSAAITNRGLVHANVAGEVMNIDPRNNGGGIITFLNNTIVRASGGGIVQLNGNGLGEFGGAGIYEAQDGSEILLASPVVRDSTFTTSGSGVVRTTNGSNSEFVNIRNEGNFEVGNNANARMIGSIVNTGTITLASVASQSDFELGADVTLTGGGTLAMTGGLPQVNAVGNFLLTNVDNTIEGRGNLGGNLTAFANESLIIANVAGEVLNIDPRNNGGGIVTFNNSGTIRASNGGMAELNGNGLGEFSNTGTIEALDGSSVVGVGNPTIQELNGSTVTAGTYRSIDEGNGATLDIAPAGFQVATNDGVIETRGAAASNDVLGSFSSGFHTNDALVQNNGKMLLDDGASLAATGLGAGSPVVNTGEMLVGNDSALDVTARVTSFDVPQDTTDAGLHVDGGTLRGSGTISGGVYMPSGELSPGDVDGQAGLLSIDGDFNMDDPDLLVEEARTTIELGGYARGTEYDSFDATGDFFGQGELHATLINNFLPDVGDEFVVATYVEDGNVPGNLWDNYSFNRVQFSLMDRSLGGQNRETVMTVLDVRDIDFDGDDDFNCTDVDALVADIAAGNNTTQFDLNFDGVVDTNDLEIWLTDAGAVNLSSGAAYLHGDANLDGVVDGQDFIAWNENRFTPTAAWCSGDFNADGIVDGQDFIVWNNNRFTSSGIVTRPGPGVVPEPSAVVIALIGLSCVTGRRRQRL